jgi:5-methylcytosine-specific restriction endonuclease McrA
MESTIRNQKRRQRERAADLLKRVCTHLGYECWWCKRPLVLARDIPDVNVLKRTADHLTWRSNRHGPITKLIATVDHVLPLADGGNNYYTNLVPSCGPCNRDRTNRPAIFARRLEQFRREAYNAELQHTIQRQGSGRSWLPSGSGQSTARRNQRASPHTTARPYSRKVVGQLQEAF